jgi:tRNA dimethylallyltransferase
MMKKILVICGPTATGKTGLGIKLAKKFSGEVVSFDSRQVYQGMDIGTGKEIQNSKLKIKNLRKGIKTGYYLISGVRIWLYDVVAPDYRFNAADYYQVALPVIKDIWRHDKLPILVGGTGFYLEALLEGIPTLGVPPDWSLRKELEKESIENLQKKLKKIAPFRWQKMNPSDRANPRRLIRALEVAAFGENKEKDTREFLGVKREFCLEKEAVLKIGLKAPFPLLRKRIDQRVEERLKQGLLEEIEGLLAEGYRFDNSRLGETLAYQEWREWFEGKEQTVALRQEIIGTWKKHEYQYARRQMTWFKKDKEIIWFDITDDDYQEKVAKLVEVWYDS